MDCDQVRDLLGPFALDALDEDEMNQVRDHLESCDEHQDAAELIAAARSLAHAAPEREPPPELKSRIMREVSPGPVERESEGGLSLAGILGWRFLQPALTGVMAAVIVGLVVWVAALQGSDDNTRVVSIGDEGLGGRVVLLQDEQVAIQESGPNCSRAGGY